MHLQYPASCYNSLSIYIKEYRTPLSPRRPLIGSSRDFTREHGSSRSWKWSTSDVDCGFLIKVTRENSVTLTLQQQRRRPAGSDQPSSSSSSSIGLCSTRGSLCYDNTIWNWSCTEVCCWHIALIVTGLATIAIIYNTNVSYAHDATRACRYFTFCACAGQLSVCLLVMWTWMAVVRWHLHRWLHVMQSSLRRIYIVHI